MYKLSPSDFAFLYEECKLCYYLKIKHDIKHPFSPFPGVFSTINTKLQTPLVGKDLKSVSKKLPEGVVEKQEGYVESKVVPGTSVFIKGKYDLLVKKPDGTYILVDLKISKPDDDKIERYKTQLFAYKFALENPAKSDPIKVTQLGLLIFYPDTVELKEETALFDFSPKWLEVPIDEKCKPPQGWNRLAHLDFLSFGKAQDYFSNCNFSLTHGIIASRYVQTLTF